VVALVGSSLNVYIKPTNEVSDKGVFDLSNDIKPIISIPNFPFQKWAFLVINVDGKTIDLYIDGKFVQTATATAFSGGDKEDELKYGNQYTLGNITRFKRVASSINPQGVWSDYMLGSGQGYSISNYHVNAQITKNKQVTVDQRLI
jgi:hypothetical protein